MIISDNTPPSPAKSNAALSNLQPSLESPPPAYGPVVGPSEQQHRQYQPYAGSPSSALSNVLRSPMDHYTDVEANGSRRRESPGKRFCKAFAVAILIYVLVAIFFGTIKMNGQQSRTGWHNDFAIPNGIAVISCTRGSEMQNSSTGWNSLQSIDFSHELLAKSSSSLPSSNGFGYGTVQTSLSLPLSSETLFLLSRGPSSSGNLHIKSSSTLEEGTARVDVRVSYAEFAKRDFSLLRQTTVCLVNKKQGKRKQNATADENTQYYHNLKVTVTNPWAPFESEIDWNIARWAKMCGPSSTALTELLAIDGVCDKLGLSFRTVSQLNAIIDHKLPSIRPKFKRREVVVQNQAFEMYFRDVLECVKALYGDAEFAEYLKYAPERHFNDRQFEEQLFHDMHTGGWWWSTQAKLDKHAGPGRTVIPIILSSDKTQVTSFRNKSVYPVYMTIGNIPKELRRKPSYRAYVLVGYLPTTRLEHIKNAASRRRSLANLFHTCMRMIVQPLEDAGATGLVIASGNGVKRHGHPIFAAHVGDYPEQYDVTLVLPESRGPSILRINAFETDLPNFHHFFTQSLDEFVTFGELILKAGNGIVNAASITAENATIHTSNREINIRSLTSNTVSLYTINSEIRGHFIISQSIDIKAVNAKVKANIELYPEYPNGGGSIILQTTQKALEAIINIHNPSYFSNFFNFSSSSIPSKPSSTYFISASNKNGIVDVSVPLLPPDSALNLTASSTNGRVTTTLPATYEGSYSLLTTNIVGEVHIEHTEDPEGLERKRLWDSNKGNGKDIRGSVYWDRSNRNKGSVVLKSANGQAELFL
ncbi:hypothetical protein GGU10DRAFT_376833 [Lentinula aff. detonsa]|uniref:DUF7330 domain-containing protein n=1 Tax=Lentinula aff. detonsa TaxID=2804958 RepID=A0AA38NPD4_9AGAR|nr:hypothetical protein GGU10DRAFT_376833 [Lentinula aff. detonsa]